MISNDDKKHQRVERIVLAAINEATNLAAVRDYEGGNALLCDAAKEHERVYGGSSGYDPVPLWGGSK